MDSPAAEFIAINQARFQTRVDYAVMKKVLETAEASGGAAVKLIESAARSQQRIVEAVEAIGADGRLDVTA
ncbi:MAG: hypothetical protein ACK4WH_14635 [Phycisphaerales bacterium]